MDCDRCGAPAVLHAAYSGQHLCESHLRGSVEKRVRRRVREDGLVPDDATPESPVTWVVGLSGGKDSVVLLDVLARTFEPDPRVELLALTIHEGIEGYRDESLAAAAELAERYDVRHEVRTYEEELGVRMDDVVETDPEDMAACAYCGVFRRGLLEEVGEAVGADLLLTGHNLDDEAQTAVMNLFSGDVDQMAKHYDASLAPLPERSDAPFVPRAKPLREVPEKEIALFARLADLPVHMAECPHASEAYRGEIQRHLLELEDAHPGTRHSIMAGYEELAALAWERREGRRTGELGKCRRCGSVTTREVCRKCALVESIEAA
ncbi:MAG: TIGR00269 family protein [Halobacteriales archaeon]